jgi:hypothetical protein
MVQSHQDSREEDTTKPIPPQETEIFVMKLEVSFTTGDITAHFQPEGITPSLLII